MEEKFDGIEKWKVRDAAETLKRAFEIRQDKKLLKAARKMLLQETKAAEKALNWSGGIAESKEG